MTTALIYIIGILITAFIAYLLVEIIWDRTPKGALSEAYSPDTKKASRLQGALSPLGIPVQKYAPPSMLRKTQANLYWAQMAGKWHDWNAVQFIALQFAAAVGGFLLGMFATQDVMMSLIAGYVGWTYPGMSVNGVARRTRRLFVSQLPEFVQLVSAQMAAGVSMEEAIQRTSKSPGLVGQWMQRVLRQAQGRNLIEQMQREAQESLLPELIGMSVQISFIRRGTAQQELMSQMAMSIAAAYIGEAEQRAEKLGSEMVVPMVIFYFVPFLATLLMVLAYPVMTNLFGGM
jgi:Flp pilus assembly protein TadB